MVDRSGRRGLLPRWKNAYAVAWGEVSQGVRGRVEGSRRRGKCEKVPSVTKCHPECPISEFQVKK